jgi:hypothetical protein
MMSEAGGLAKNSNHPGCRAGAEQNNRLGVVHMQTHACSTGWCSPPFSQLLSPDISDDAATNLILSLEKNDVSCLIQALVDLEHVMCEF